MSVTQANSPADLLLDRIIPPRAPFSAVLRRGEVLRIVDVAGQQAVDALFYNAADHQERYSAQDTVLAQNGPYLGLGAVLLSNEGRPMMTLTADSCGRHDTSAGCCSCESNAVRFGHDTRHQHACRENFILELMKYGMTKRDIVANVNFFMNVPVTEAGALAVDDGISAPGSHVELRAEMDTLVVISNCPQINNPCNGFDPTPLRVTILGGAARSP